MQITFFNGCAGEENRQELLNLGALEPLLKQIMSEDKVVRRNATMCLGTMAQNGKSCMNRKKCFSFKYKVALNHEITCISAYVYYIISWNLYAIVWWSLIQSCSFETAVMLICVSWPKLLPAKGVLTNNWFCITLLMEIHVQYNTDLL